MTARNVSTLQQIETWYEAHPPRLACTAGTREEFEVWRGKARARVRSLLGLDRLEAEEQAPVNVERTEEFEEEAYRAEKLYVQTQGDMWVPSWVLVPKTGWPPFPTVLCFPGHGMSKDILIGRPTSEKEQELLEQFKGDYGKRFAERGYLAFCPDTRAWGERGEEHDCGQVTVNALAVGQVLGGLRIWDHLRCLDYLVTREDVDSGRIGATGLSMGCEHTMYVSALDDRISAAVLSCCLRDLRREIHKRFHCICSYVPDLFTWFDWSDIACLIAPRPALIQQGVQDTIPTDLVQSAEQKMRSAYALWDFSEGLGTDYFAGGHEFHFPPAALWMDRWLKQE
jgi:hypothetical protein